MKHMVVRWAGRRQLSTKMREYIDKLLHSAVKSEDVVLIHRLKLDLESDFEVRVRSLQTLLDLNHRPAITYAIRELVRVSSQWSRHSKAHAQSEFLLRLLFKELPPDEWADDM